MSEYKILTESTTDLPQALIEETDVHVIPMIFTIDGKDYMDDPAGRSLSAHEFYEMQRGGKMSTTAQVNSETFKAHARPWLDKGQDVLYLAFSSGLSGTCNAARLAAEDLREAYPERQIVVVDTLAASMGEGLLVYLAAGQKKQGKSLQEVASWVENTKSHLAQWFTVDDLNHLKRGGRVSNVAAFVGTLLSIKPVLHVDDDGHLVAIDKVRGRRQSLDALVAQMEKTAVDPAGQTVFISHGDCEQDCAYVADSLRSRLGIKTIYTNTIGPVIGSHSGPGTVALFYLGTSKN